MSLGTFYNIQCDLASKMGTPFFPQIDASALYNAYGQ